MDYPGGGLPGGGLPVRPASGEQLWQQRWCHVITHNVENHGGHLVQVAAAAEAHAATTTLIAVLEVPMDRSSHLTTVVACSSG